VRLQIRFNIAKFRQASESIIKYINNSFYEGNDMSTISKEYKYLNRYTSKQHLLDTLKYKRLTLLDPRNWEDTNDSYFLELYKQCTKSKTMLALCFTEYEYDKYQYWKIYARKIEGVCIRFDKEKLIKCFDNVTLSGISYNKVDYKTLSELKKNKHLRCADLPFIKRKAFQDEKEFRFIFESNNEAITNKHVFIGLNCILQITFNPWIDKSTFQSISTEIREIEGCENIKIRQTRIINYKEWKKVGESIACL
jgi:hypothetical protein